MTAVRVGKTLCKRTKNFRYCGPGTLSLSEENKCFITGARQYFSDTLKKVLQGGH